MTRLHGTALDVGYDDRRVLEGVDVAIPDGSFTVIVGPNACGKSTLLRALARLLRPTDGSATLDDRDVHAWHAREFARVVGLLPQTALAPDGITVADLVSRGRYPHQSLLSRWSRADERAVADAMAATGVTDLRDRALDELSGGQRQRVWIAMVLAQETQVLLLDEPTTYLDIAHQVELLDLVAELRAHGRTVVAVLHELNHAARYATHLIAMKGGRIVAEGAPEEIVTEELVEEVFGMPCRVIPDPDTGSPVVLPRSRPALRPGAMPARAPA
ncbi:ABC transporter ATP-binding protein [Oerskovia enterophila]|uniref:Putative siderophore transport system ATP-binding protein YusV n=1 Tax=Oerskovia enterophila TaxID=43678 RepID=A0A163PZ44_9CELL|nr:ABC transporter ATP-binding protein [Oerskovia enterophila]KZM33654.1 putative siderophore transport system ATP-binding protein YusV [Oerskovia enterophila]